MSAFFARLFAWYIGLSISAATAIACLIFMAFCFLTILVIAYFAPRKVEMRQIRRRRRKDRQIRISAQELQKRREEVDVRVSRGFMKAYRERCQ